MMDQKMDAALTTELQAARDSIREMLDDERFQKEVAEYILTKKIRT
jgi:hypothetical protein